jgi:hypothetical protein
VTNRLVVGSGTIVLSDQAQVRAGTLALGGGQIVGTAPLVLGSTSLQGTGYVGTAVTGGLADSSVTARGGTLIVGDPNSTSGFLTLGATNAEQNARLVLASARLITLGARSELGAGGMLQTFKGAYLGAGSELRASQGGTVFGSFINDGQVAGPASGTSDLTFNDNVNGAGAFSGRVRFLQHYSPSANAQVEELNLAPTATLLLGVPAGGVNAAEALTVTGQALLDGTLDLGFNVGYAPPSGGGQFVLINWRHFEGRFANFTVEGLTPGWTAALNYDADALRVSISAVPEPAAWLLMLTGLLAVRSAPRPRAGCLQA